MYIYIYISKGLERGNIYIGFWVADFFFKTLDKIMLAFS